MQTTSLAVVSTLLHTHGHWCTAYSSVCLLPEDIVESAVTNQTVYTNAITVFF